MIPPPACREPQARDARRRRVPRGRRARCGGSAGERFWKFLRVRKRKRRAGRRRGRSPVSTSSAEARLSPSSPSKTKPALPSSRRNRRGEGIASNARIVTPGACAVRGGGGTGPPRSSSRGIALSIARGLSRHSARGFFPKSQPIRETVADSRASAPEDLVQALGARAADGKPRAVREDGRRRAGRRRARGGRAGRGSGGTSGGSGRTAPSEARLEARERLLLEVVPAAGAEEDVVVLGLHAVDRRDGEDRHRRRRP